MYNYINNYYNKYCTYTGMYQSMGCYLLIIDFAVEHCEHQPGYSDH